MLLAGGQIGRCFAFPRNALFLVVFFLVSCSGGGGSGSEDRNSFSSIPTSKLNKASRFLSQAGFGGTLEEVEEVANLGESAWLSKQFAMAPNLHAAEAIQNHAAYCAIVPEPNCIGDGVLWAPFFRRFILWDRVVNSPDQVHQKVAYALSQIFVVSDLQDGLQSISALAHWWDLLLTHGLSNYRDLLEAVTLSPAMGVYLSHYTNSKGDPQNGVFPDENYAREVMQLFSIGLYELNPDGTRKKDINGNDIPTYNNADIREFAKVFTGLANGCGYQQFEVFAPVAFECPMKMYEAHHATGAKYLLRGQVVPDNQSGMQDISDAIDNLYNHPNVGPFIGRLLIQRLVKSNPSPQYIARVSAAFSDNGKGVRGDMKAVVAAILLDAEAAEKSAASGKVRDPFLRMAHVFRALELSSKTGKYYNAGTALGQKVKQFPLNSPSVFNFYSPDHVPFGEAGDLGLFSPELEITNSTSVPSYYNLVISSVVSDFLEERDKYGGEDMDLNFAKLEAYIGSPGTLAEYINVLFMHGEMTSVTRQAIVDIIRKVVTWDRDGAVRMAVALALVSPEYIVRR